MASDAQREQKPAGATAEGAREVARRNRDAAGKPLNAVMKTAATACELARTAEEGERR